MHATSFPALHACDGRQHCLCLCLNIASASSHVLLPKLSLAMHTLQAAEEGLTTVAAVLSKAALKRARKKAAARAAAAVAAPAAKPPAAEPSESTEVSCTAESAAVQTARTASNKIGQSGDMVAVVSGQEQQQKQQQQAPAWTLCPITKVGSVLRERVVMGV